MKMAPGVKEEDSTAKGESNWFNFKLSVIFILLSISSLAIPATGFALKSCRITSDHAICSKNNLKAVPQDIPPRVKGFDLSGNNISRIRVLDFKNLSCLIYLDLKNNHISQIDEGAFSSLNVLQTLDLSNNSINKLEDYLFEGLNNLKVLNLKRNYIKTLPASFKSLKRLTCLNISDNNLDHMTKAISIILHLPHLRTLAMKNSSITTFQPCELTNTSTRIASLDLSQNPITAFRMTADVFPVLTDFSISSLPKQHTTWDVRNKTFLRAVTFLDIGGLHLALSDARTLLESFNSSLTSLRMDAMNLNLTALINIVCTIPTLTKLYLKDNKLKSSDLFQACIYITELDLSSNKIKNVPNNSFSSLRGLSNLRLNQNMLSSVPFATRTLTTLVQLDLGKNKISSLACDDFANLTNLTELRLHQNSISALKNCVFKDLLSLQVLRLETNKITQLKGSFEKYLPNLKELRLNNNHLRAIGEREFEGLVSLRNLSLHENKINSLVKNSFTGLTNLTVITLQCNTITEKELSTGCFNELVSLRRLDLRNNHIQYADDSSLPEPPFSQLSRLKTLSIPSQHRRGKSKGLPRNFLEGLSNLLFFDTRNVQILSLHAAMFNHSPRLEKLDMSSNDLFDISPDLFSPIRNLKSLYISRTSLMSLDVLVKANLSKLEFLQSRKNQFSVIDEDVIASLPSLSYVDLQGNSFTCDCDNVWFIQWVKDNQATQVSGAYNFVCNYPPNFKGMKLLDLDVQSCTLDYGFKCFICTTCAVNLLMLASFVYRFLRWQVVYGYYLFLALLFDTKQKNKRAPCRYDAFISYNAHDEAWVIGELLPKLEGEQGWKLCLHHRDFQPGRAIIDNITDAIYGSRKTICVITRRYLDSEWCSMEIQTASFRLFDEKKDVLILVFLEEIPSDQLSPYHRMRKLLKRQTYLSWPRVRGHTELFWEKVRRAMETSEDPGEDRLLLQD